MATSSSTTDLLADPLLRDVPVLEGHKVLAGVALYAKVGQGGMGVVYRGRHCLLDIDMAVKVLKPSLVAEDERFALRFRREAQVAAHITHQNVVRLYEANQQHGLHYLLMEFVDGESARDRVPRKGPLSEQEALGILLGAAAGVAEAHRVGVVHRDLKPDNVLIARDGRVKVADLGLVKRDGAHGDSMTLGSGIMGTPQYMAPEQWDSPDVTAAADVWALGATLWYLLVGAHAIEVKSFAAVARRVQEQEFPSLRQARPDLRVQVYELFERCMRRAPAERFADARALVEALLPLVRGEQLLADPEAGLGGSRPALPTPPPRATIERIRDALGTDTQLAGSAVKRSEAQTIVSKGRTVRAVDRSVAVRRAAAALVLAGGLGLLAWYGNRAGWFGGPGVDEANALVSSAESLLARDAGSTEAIAQLEQALQRSPGAERAKRLLASALATKAQALRATDLDGAYAAAKRLIEVEPTDRDAEATRQAIVKDLGDRMITGMRLELPEPTPPMAPETLESMIEVLLVAPSPDFEVVGRIGSPTVKKLWLALRADLDECKDVAALRSVAVVDGAFRVVLTAPAAGLWLLDWRPEDANGLSAPCPPIFIMVPGVLGTRRPAVDLGASAPEVLINGVGIVMNPIPVRTFKMGSAKQAPGHRDDETQHDVTLTQPFWLGETEVTRAQWVRVMDTTPWLEQRDPAPREEPAVRITWGMANEFCARLTRSEREHGRLPAGHSYCLPSEAQWELAAHGGDDRTWPHGEDAAELEQYAVFGRPVGFADRAGQKKPNPFRLHDLAGNADEWCEDLALAKDGRVTTPTYRDGVADPIGDVGALHVYRGGNYGSPPADCRTAARFAAPPETARDTLGFRVALARR